MEDLTLEDDAYTAYVDAKWLPASAKGIPHPGAKICLSKTLASNPHWPDDASIARVDRLAQRFRWNLSSPQYDVIGHAYSTLSRTIPNDSGDVLLRGPNRRAAFINGCGTGVGKGRICVGTIEGLFHDRKIDRGLWVSVNSNLFADACRDAAIAAPDGLTTGMKLFKPSMTMTDMQSTRFLFATYTQMADTNNVDTLIKWLRGDDACDGCTGGCSKCDGSKSIIVFDESHIAKNVGEADKMGSKCSTGVLKMQSALPMAYVVCCSATGANKPTQLAYIMGIPSKGYADTNEMLCDVEDAAAATGRVVGMDELWNHEFPDDGGNVTGFWVTVDRSYPLDSFKEYCEHNDLDMEVYARLDGCYMRAVGTARDGSSRRVICSHLVPPVVEYNITTLANYTHIEEYETANARWTKLIQDLDDDKKLVTRSFVTGSLLHVWKDIMIVARTAKDSDADGEKVSYDIKYRQMECPEGVTYHGVVLTETAFQELNDRLELRLNPQPEPVPQPLQVPPPPPPPPAPAASGSKRDHDGGDRERAKRIKIADLMAEMDVACAVVLERAKATISAIEAEFMAAKQRVLRE